MLYCYTDEAHTLYLLVALCMQRIASMSLLTQHTMEEGQNFSLCGKAAVTELNLSKSEYTESKQL